MSFGGEVEVDGNVIALAATKAGGGQRNESGRGEEDEAMMTAAAMLPCEGRRWAMRVGGGRRMRQL